MAAHGSRGSPAAPRPAAPRLASEVPVRLARLLALVGLLSVLFAALPAVADGPNIRFYDRTGHTVSGAFLTFLHDRGDPDMLGAPLTEAIVQNNAVVQYFERGALQL